MKITGQVTDEVILHELGHRIARIRLERNLTQAQLALEAGVAKRTVERLESGAAATQLSGFLRICRVLNLLERLETLVPEPVPSPLAQLQLQGRQRKRASRPRPPVLREQPWQWGPET
ncbi:MAG TPA: helix-turn-helix transcriptional regulator [Verrucomicrobiae bacterium]